MHFSRSIASHFQHRRSMIGTENNLSLSCFSYRWWSLTGRQAADCSGVNQRYEDFTLSSLSFTSKSGKRIPYVKWLFGQPEKNWKTNRRQSIFSITIVIVGAESNRQHQCRNRKCSISSSQKLLVLFAIDVRGLVSPPVRLWTIPDETQRLFWWCCFLIKNGKYNV